MSKKKRRAVQRTPARAAGDLTSSIENAPAPAKPAPEAPAVAAARRRVERVGAGRPGRPGRGTSASDFAPLDPDDAAIPFDRVPYVPGDLRRVAIMAVLMIILIIIAAIYVPKLIGS